jgi:glutaredoxin-related protein
MKKLFISLCLFLAISTVFAQTFVPDPNKFYNLVESTSSNVIGIGSAGSQPALMVSAGLSSQAFKFVPTGATDTYYVLSASNLYVNVNSGATWATVAQAAINGTFSEWVIEGADAVTVGIKLKCSQGYFGPDGNTPGNSVWTNKGSGGIVLYKLQETTPPTTLYSENFEADFAASGDVKTFAPSTEAGKWIGGKDLVTNLDSTISLRGDVGGWASHGYTLQMAPTTSATPSAAVTIPDIAITGYDNLKLSFETVWLYWTDGEGNFKANPASEKAPGIEIKSGTGSWIALTTDTLTGNWATQTLTLPAVDNTLPLSIRISGSMRYTYIINDLLLTGKAVTLPTNVNQLSDNSFEVYPNPATNYILTKNAQKVTILDLNGRIVKEAYNIEKVDVSSLAKGAYIVKAQIVNSTKIGKLIKE